LPPIGGGKGPLTPHVMTLNEGKGPFTPRLTPGAGTADTRETCESITDPGRRQRPARTRRESVSAVRSLLGYV